MDLPSDRSFAQAAPGTPGEDSTGTSGDRPDNDRLGVSTEDGSGGGPESVGGSTFRGMGRSLANLGRGR